MPFNREKLAGEASRVGGEKGGREAYGVVGESFGVWGEEGGRKAYRVAENSGGGPPGVQRGVELP